ncbi:MAG: hypothetical protein ACO3EZ_13105 [Prochlorotrichaceae cyanobacterium]
MKKRGGVYYAAPDDRENLSCGAFLIALRGLSPKDNDRNRQRALDQILAQLDQGDFPEQSFSNGLGVKDLIFIPPDITMSPSETTPLALEEQDIVIAANELIELARLKVDLAKAFQTAQHYKAVVLKVVSPDSGHLTEEECQIVLDKAFAKTIKALAESRVKVTQCLENSAARRSLILNELTFMDEEIAHILNPEA